ncbi:uncharacterized protein BDZ99DRAFT_565219 [Mytilinidion resinicola]|uniref:Uncharacterized protein n=1 Tax=Mytilinidion resinicola TaxID=574789 RepID=A0A6A6ZAZ0_9PEZI|nr:uncharacterized protein BDZ99DRAFT_565219 [Mytilinidion resinicola]KAF2817474.1 hypothetical protein BDZ99DRAFT_565219 [Mytilinidion resinicola]
MHIFGMFEDERNCHVIVSLKSPVRYKLDRCCSPEIESPSNVESVHLDMLANRRREVSRGKFLESLTCSMAWRIGTAQAVLGGLAILGAPDGSALFEISGSSSHDISNSATHTLLSSLNNPANKWKLERWATYQREYGRSTIVPSIGPSSQAMPPGQQFETGFQCISIIATHYIIINSIDTKDATEESKVSSRT